MTVIPGLTIELTRRADGGSVLQCIRRDGTVTWQRHDGHQAAFFPGHDLTHYAVETVLGFGCGFFGLIAAGWEIEETDGKGARGALPPEAVLVEHLVGFLDVERTTGAEWSASEYATQLALRGMDTAGLPRPLTDAALYHVRRRRDALLAEWATVQPGSRLELDFAVSAWTVRS